MALTNSIDLSVIIPTYNRADFLDDCLGSLHACGLGSLEVLVVDDGSTDATRARYEADPRCRYHWQPNRGPAAARNFGFERSRGRYVAFLDSDDRWLPGVCPRLIDLLERHPEVDAIFTEASVGNPDDGFRSWIEVAGQSAFFALPNREPEPGLRIMERVPFFRRMARRNPIFIGSLIMRRGVFERAGGFDVELCGAADWELWLRMASRMTFAYWPESLAIYTRHADCMSNHHDRMKAEFCLSLDKILRKCTDLAPGERAWVRECLRDQAYGLAYDAYDRGDLTLARERFARCLHGRLDLKALGFWLVSHLPPDVLQRTRAWKRGLVR